MKNYPVGLNDAEQINWHWDLTTNAFHVSDHFFDFFNLSKQDGLQGHINIVNLLQGLIDNEDLEVLKVEMTKLRRMGLPVKKLWKVTLDGQEKEIIFEAHPVMDGQMVRQIRGRIAEPGEMLDSRRFQQLAVYVISKSIHPVLIIDKDLRILKVNDAALEALLYGKHELNAGVSLLKIDIENTRSQWDSFFNLLRQERTHTIETSFQRKNGTIFPVEITLSYFADESGELIFLRALDITERRREESTLQPALAEHELARSRLEAEKVYLQEENLNKYKFENIITVSKAYKKILNRVKQVAPTDATVLIEGESGTGKELLARAIHQFSRRSRNTMIKINCANLPKELIESELFGHERGAFTGAIQLKKGRFELADGGTFFLDEIGEMPLELQSRLLRVLQEGEFERVGGQKLIRVDVRIIAATNRNLSEMVEKGIFRRDLYYRLNVFPIDSIPLRERKEDIPVLTRFFLERYSKKMNRSIEHILAKDLERLQGYDFPGNVRELENIIERSVILSDTSTLNLDFWRPRNTVMDSSNSNFPTLEEIQKSHILEALKKTNWRVSGEGGAAQLLGIKDQTLFSKMRKLKIRRI